jgi:hypothetical protein
MINAELTASGRVKGDLVLDPELRKILRVGLSRMAWLRRMGLGPPSFRRPGSNRWMTWRGEILDYLESDRSLPAAPGSREAIVITKKPAAKPKQAKAAKAVKHRRSRNQSSGIAAE